VTTSALPRDGATIMLVRDGDQGPRPLEVFMLQRHPRTAFGSIHVFPGGVVDDHDRSETVAARAPGRSDDAASAELGVGSGGLGFWIAAIREAFEEAGVLLARTADGAPLQLDDPRTAERFHLHRRSLHAGEVTFAEVLAAEALTLTVDEVHYWSHWITPEGEPKRFDTRFFVAAAPAGHTYAHDDVELIGSGWVRPADALNATRDGRYPMIMPTIATLEELDHGTVTDLFEVHRASLAGVPRGPR
jgi:8-oxo-dGTP pyrophosphatase MutT (NUDIX family)